MSEEDLKYPGGYSNNESWNTTSETNDVMYGD